MKRLIINSPFLKPIFYLFLSFYLQLNLYAQSLEIKGLVYLEENLPAVGASVQILSKNKNILAYTTTDANGHWVLNVQKTNDSLYMRISYLGYETKYDTLLHTNFPIKTTLESITTDIEIVEVKAQRIGIKARGDTIFYDIAAYTDSTEYDLKEVLEKLPLFSVSDDGSMKYRGKRVDKILVEGKDIFGEMHKQMVEGIKASDIKQVQIIDNYKTMDGAIQKPNENLTAVNIELKKEKKKKISGNIEILAGLPKKYEANSTIFKLGQKWSGTFMGRANNSLQPILSPTDMIGLLDLNKFTKEQTSFKIDNLMPKGLQMSPNSKTNKDAFASIRTLIEPSKQLKITTILFYAHLNNSIAKNFSQDFFLQNRKMQGEEKTGKASAIYNLSSTLDYVSKNKIFSIHAHLPLVSTPEDDNLFSIGVLNDTFPFLNQNRIKSKNLRISPEVQMGYDLDSKNRIFLGGQYTMIDIHKNYYLNSIDTLFERYFPHVLQTSQRKENVMTSHIGYEIKYKYSKTHIEAAYSTNRFEVDAQTLPFGDSLWNKGFFNTDNKAQLSLYQKFDKKKWRSNNHIKTAYIVRQNKNLPSTAFYTYDAKLSYFYDFKQFNTISIQTNLQATPLQSSNGISIFQIENFNTLNFENLPLNSGLNRTLRANLQYFKMDVLSGNSFIAGGNTTIQKNLVAYKLENKGVYWLNTPYLADIARSFDGNLMLNRKKFLFLSDAGISGNFAYQTTSQKESSSNRVNIFNTQISLFSSFSHKKIRLKANLELLNTRQSMRLYQTSVALINFYSVKPSIQIQYKTNNFLARFNFALPIQFNTNQESVSNTTADILLEWQPKKMPLKIVFKGYNISNFSNPLVLSTQTTLNYTATEYYTLNKIMALIGVKIQL